MRFQVCLSLRSSLLAIVLGALLPAATVKADIIFIQADEASATEGIGNFIGSINYDSTPGSTVGTLTVTLTNTSNPANGGLITAFLFNIGSSDSAASATLTSTSHSSFLDAASSSGQPFGSLFDAGAGLGGVYLGGGNPNGGIAVGATGTFVFHVSASDAGSLSAIDFLDGGPYQHNFIVRFRGFEDGGSDKVAGGVLIPLPAPLAMGLLGLGGVIVGVSRRRKSR